MASAADAARVLPARADEGHPRKELGEQDETARDRDSAERIEAAHHATDVKKEALKELGRLRVSPVAADYGLTRNSESSGWPCCRSRCFRVEVDTAKAEEILDSDHYDLEKVKDRILDTSPCGG